LCGVVEWLVSVMINPLTEGDQLRDHRQLGTAEWQFDESNFSRFTRNTFSVGFTIQSSS
jgi:hypothetical protein